MKRRFVTAEMRERMRQMQDEGKTRSEIARELDLAPSTVTKALGPVRSYRFARVQAA